jgi:uncharacterized protein (DUF1778 family)
VRPSSKHFRIDIVDTKGHISLMSKGRSLSSEAHGAETVAVAERPSTADTKGSINLRIEASTRQLIDDAAAILGKTRTEFMHALDNPPAPGPKLRSLLRRVPAWRT